MNNYFMETHHHEWILSNRLGGYALGTGNLINQRKYHGLLVAGDDNFQRTHLVAGMEEKVEWRGESFHLDSNNYSNCIFPEGFLYLVKPWLRPYPIFLYSALPHQNSILIRKEIMMDEDSNTVLIKYTNLGHHKLHFELRPRFTMINHHDINAPGSLDTEQFETSIHPSENGYVYEIKRTSNDVNLFGYAQKGEFIANRLIYRNVFYPWEVMNGYEGVGDQIALVEIRFDLKVGEANYFLFSDKCPANPASLIEAIQNRYKKLPLPKDYPSTPDTKDKLLSTLDYEDGVIFNRKDYLKILEFALRDFVTHDDIIAGYPWYGAWGRDTMFVLNSFLHLPNGIKQAETILAKYGDNIKNGLIPNTLPESGREVNYDSIDATLWFIILLYKLGKKKNTIKYWDETIKTTETILKAFLTNSSYPFQIRADGLLELEVEFAHSTWMDIRLNGKAITPRNGAPVEINALWYNAICSYEDMCKLHNDKALKKVEPNPDITSLKLVVQKSFSKFWLGDYLADRLLVDEPVREFRPNGLIAASLPWPLLSDRQLELLFEKTYSELYTFYGIRSLSPHDIKYRKKYYGNQSERDQAYHNGSNWAWLLSAFCGLYLKVKVDKIPKTDIVHDLSNFVSVFRNGFQKGHIASIAELWDGDSPHFPKGAPAMAWSVAALYNIENYISRLEENSK